MLPYTSFSFAFTIVLLFLCLVYQGVEPNGGLRRGCNLFLRLELRVLKRLSFTFVLELSICIFISIAIIYSPNEILYAALMLTVVSICAVVYLHLFCRKMRTESIYEK